MSNVRYPLMAAALMVAMESPIAPIEIRRPSPLRVVTSKKRRTPKVRLKRATGPGSLDAITQAKMDKIAEPLIYDGQIEAVETLVSNEDPGSWF